MLMTSSFQCLTRPRRRTPPQPVTVLSQIKPKAPSSNFVCVDICSTQPLCRGIGLYSRHFVAARINAPAVVFTLDHFVTTQRTMGWTKSLLDPGDYE